MTRVPMKPVPPMTKIDMSVSSCILPRA